VEHPLFPNESTVSMINLDMVGRLRDNELTLYGTGSADGLVDIIDRANARYQFDLFKVETGYGPSDHQSFYKAGVPVIFFFTGLHNDYHRPTDDADKINYASTARITQMVGDVALQLAVRGERPKYAETENRVSIRRQLTAFIGVTLSDQGDHVLLSSISAGGPAAVAGLRGGDRLVTIGKKQIVNSADVLNELRGRSPGQTLKIRVLRSEHPLDVTVTLAARPNG
jgi:C-terminal processing protease CtpA/Prc